MCLPVACLLSHQGDQVKKNQVLGAIEQLGTMVDVKVRAEGSCRTELMLHAYCQSTWHVSICVPHLQSTLRAERFSLIVLWENPSAASAGEAYSAQQGLQPPRRAAAAVHAC